LLLGERILFGGGHGACASSLVRPRGRPAGNAVATGTDSGKSLVLPAPARLLPLLPTVNSNGSTTVASTTAKGRGLSPPAFGGRQRVLPGDARKDYLTSTVAPAASRSFFIFSASSFDTPSFTVPPASVRSLASF